MSRVMFGQVTSEWRERRAQKRAKQVARFFPFASRREMDAARHKADVAVGRALAKGELKREPCEQCGKRKSEAHHDDYSKPLAVRWLCRPHHRQWHKENKIAPVDIRASKVRDMTLVDHAWPLIIPVTERLRTLTTEQRISDVALAQRIGCSRQMVSTWFAAGIRTLKALYALSEAMDCEVQIVITPRERSDAIGTSLKRYTPVLSRQEETVQHG